MNRPSTIFIVAVAQSQYYALVKVKSLLLACLSLVLFNFVGIAHALTPMAPIQIEHANADVSPILKGWTVEPTQYSKNRIVLRNSGYSGARLLAIGTTMLDSARSPKDFKRSVKDALKLEGVSNVKFLEVRHVQSQVTDAFRVEAKIPDATFITWLISGNDKHGEVKGAGISIITAAGSDPGTSVEVFIAPTKEYEYLGGAVVLLARLFDVYFVEPNPQNILDSGRESPSKSAEQMAQQFEVFMTGLMRKRAAAGIATEQTRSTLLGLDQVVPSGLQDSMYGW